jgi:hypothetical protein
MDGKSDGLHVKWNMFGGMPRDFSHGVLGSRSGVVDCAGRGLVLGRNGGSLENAG